MTDDSFVESLAVSDTVSPPLSLHVNAFQSAKPNNGFTEQTDFDARYSVSIEELERIELPVGATNGYLLMKDERRPLPVGSTLKGGRFYWQPGPGFLGEYELVFERPGSAPVRVRVVIRPKSYAPARLQ